MKRKGYLFNKFEDIEFIKFCIKSASKHKTRREKVIRVLSNLDERAETLQRMLLNNEFKPSPLNISERWDPRNKKFRTISSPRFFPDQCIHWCVIMAIKEIIMHGMYAHSCGNIPGRGRMAGVKYVKKVLKTHSKNTKWCLKMDIRHFYQTIDHEILMSKLSKRIKDKQILTLIEKIIDSYDKGLPLGNYTSQWLANFFLQDMDHYIKEQLKAPYYIRYVDDMVIIGPNKKKLHKMRKAIEAYLNEMGMKLKGNWQVFKVDDRGIDFLGYVFFHGYTKLRDRNFINIKRQATRFKKLDREDKKPSLHFSQSYLSRIAQLKHCNSFHIKEKYLKPEWERKSKEEIRRWSNGNANGNTKKRDKIPEGDKRTPN